MLISSKRRLRDRLTLVGIVLAALSSPPAQAQSMQQGLNREAWQVQQGMNSGVLNGAQGVALDNQINQVQQQENVDRAMNGGHLTGAERQQIGSEMRSVGQNIHGSAYQNGYNPQMMRGNNMMGNNAIGSNGMFGARHQHHHMNMYNGQMNLNQMGGMNGYGRQYGYGGYPNQQNGMFGQSGYGQYGQYGQQQASGQQGGLGNAAQMLRKLF